MALSPSITNVAHVTTSTVLRRHHHRALSCDCPKPFRFQRRRPAASITGRFARPFYSPARFLPTARATVPAPDPNPGPRRDSQSTVGALHSHRKIAARMLPGPRPRHPLRLRAASRKPGSCLRSFIKSRCKSYVAACFWSFGKIQFAAHERFFACGIVQHRLGFGGGNRMEIASDPPCGLWPRVLPAPDCGPQNTKMESKPRIPGLEKASACPAQATAMRSAPEIVPGLVHC